MVQRKAAHFVFNPFARNSSVTALLERLNWTTLESRRNHAKVTMFHKIINYMTFLTTYNHHLQQHTAIIRGLSPESTLTISPFLIRMWNSLPIKVVTVENVDDFKTTCTHLHS